MRKRPEPLLAMLLCGCTATIPGAPGDAIVTDGAVAGDGAPPPPVPDRGAAVPWIESEAEDGTTTGEVVGPSRELGTAAGEASGRRAVILDAPGEEVGWTVTRDANAIVVRYSIPDAPGGGGIEATLSLHVDGVKRATLPLSSKPAWVYGD